jgi:hypothetical protein
MQKSIPAKSPFATLPNLDELAAETGFVTRESRRLCPSTFLQTLAAAVASGRASYNQIAMGLSDRTGQTITSQGVHQRFSNSSTAFLTSVLHRLLAERFTAQGTSEKLGPICRLLVEDSSVQALPKANAETFPAHGNRHGSTAGVKIDFGYDLLSGQVISHTLHSATEQDRSIGPEFLTEVRKDDLVLRDMGYFSLSEFDEIERLEAFWLTRVPLTLGLFTETGERIETVLKRSVGGVLDLSILAGAEGKSCRLVAVRASGQVTRARRKKRREEAAAKGHASDPTGLLRDGWHLMLTNLPVADFTPSLLRAIYRARWGVEIQFRAWKQAQNLDKALNRKSSEAHLMAIVLVAMINHLLGMRLARLLQRTKAKFDLSYEKLYDALALYQPLARRWEDILTFHPFPKHVQRDKRKRKSPVTAGSWA